MDNWPSSWRGRPIPIFFSVTKASIRSYSILSTWHGEVLGVQNAIFSHQTQAVSHTPAKINIEPENDGLEDDFPVPGVYSQVPCESSNLEGGHLFCLLV